MFSHVHTGVTDFERAFAFYSAVLQELDLVLTFKEGERSWAGWRSRGADRPLLLIGRPYDGALASAGNGQMVALLAQSRNAVDRCHAAALANGGVSEGPPGLRPQYHAHYYGAYFRDPDGNKLCVCRHEPEPLL
ncbi:VOC family protein [Methylosinus sp. Sm6]|uniref:VOC family protein n=1 Tax=Methylosinus sp. Sm6 TaxID=2866948 RepID=UPI001C995924|nr:VOC family protein [Methylosinus sp. Sm6]MBY6241737.1 VOC family protein [Methylosinus sp. Sm6]